MEILVEVSRRLETSEHGESSMKMFCLLLLWVGASHSATLQFAAPSPDRPLALYRAPSPYREPGKARLSSFIITSKPYTIGEESQQQQLRSELKVSTASTTTRPKSALQHISIECTGGKVCSETISINSTPSPTSKPYSADVLEKFLSDYAAVTKNKNKYSFKQEETPSSTAKYIGLGGFGGSKKGSSEKDISDEQVPVEPTNRLASVYLDEDDPPDSQHEASSVVDAKSKIHWSIVPAKHHNHPYDHRDGWVTLEAIPWSTTKISKWQSSSSALPSHPWDGNRPISNRPPSVQLDWHQEKPTRPWEYGSEKPLKPQYLGDSRPWNDDRPHGDYEYKPSHSQGHWSSSPDIITDESPSKWPTDSGQRPLGSFKPWQSSGGDYNYYSESHHRPTYSRPHNHPDSGDGEWVLLSSTKGYSVPQRHQSYRRAITFSAKPITSTRAVRLTVLPAVNGSINTTTSHGGLLEVESTFQTVDEAQRDDALKNGGTKDDNAPVRHQAITAKLVAAPSRKANGKAVLAAVGAGIVPATMGLLVPMVLGRKRRSIPIESTTGVTVPLELPFLNHENS